MEQEKYIIVEIIPEAISPDKGPIVQLSALKLDGFILEDRFDYRLNPEKVTNKDLLAITSYDKDLFHYVDTSEEIIHSFQEWAENRKLLIIDNSYTKNYLEKLPNQKESIFSYLGMKYSDDIIDKIILQYHLEPSNYIVDLLFESLIYASNEKR